MQHLDEGTIHAWLDGALDAPERERIEQHLASCVECEALVAEARGLVAGASRILGALDDVPGDVVPRRTAVPPTRADLAASARPETVVTPLAARRPRSWVTANAFRIAAAITIVAAGALAGRYGLYSGSQPSTASSERSLDAVPALEAVATTGAAVTTTDTSTRQVAASRQAAPSSAETVADAAARRDAPAAAPAPRAPRQEVASVGRAGGVAAAGAGAATSDARLSRGESFAANQSLDSAQRRAATVVTAAPPLAPPPSANADAVGAVAAAKTRVAVQRGAERRPRAAAPEAAALQRPADAASAEPSRARDGDPARLRALAGCWRFDAPSLAAERADGSAPVLLSPLALDTTVVSEGLGAGAYHVRTTSETRPDFVPYRYLHWRPLGDGRLEIILSSGFGGMRIELAGRGDRLRGTAQTLTDVRGIGERSFAVEAVRVGCR